MLTPPPPPPLPISVPRLNWLPVQVLGGGDWCACSERGSSDSAGLQGTPKGGLVETPCGVSAASPGPCTAIPGPSPPLHPSTYGQARRSGRAAGLLGGRDEEHYNDKPWRSSKDAPFAFVQIIGGRLNISFVNSCVITHRTLSTTLDQFGHLPDTATGFVQNKPACPEWQ